MKRKVLKYLIIVLPCLISLILWLYAKIEAKEVPGSIFIIFTQLTALLGTTLLTLSLILSTRSHFIEEIFEGLDKNYKIHALIGSLGFLLIISHPLLLVLNVLPDYAFALKYVLPSNVARMNFGVAGLYVFIIAFICMTFIKLPYKLWIKSHKILVIAYILGGIHSLLAHSDTYYSMPMRTWMFSLIMVGSASGIYILFLYQRFGPKYSYIVTEIFKNSDTVNVTLAPAKTKMLYTPGQFIYIKFSNKELGFETHPFSLSSSPDENTIRISAKALGDYTKHMDKIKIGDKATIFGPYGKFGQEYLQDNTYQIWIGGGVGITPFMSMLHQEAIRPKQGNILFFYSYQKITEGVFTPEIQALLKYTPRVQFYEWCADTQGFINATEILKHTQSTINYKVFICGPLGMMLALQKQFIAAGIKKEDIIFENFSFLT